VWGRGVFDPTARRPPYRMREFSSVPADQLEDFSLAEGMVFSSYSFALVIALSSSVAHFPLLFQARKGTLSSAIKRELYLPSTVPVSRAPPLCP